MKPVILVVDDEPLQREIMKTILEGEGYQVETASSGAEALALMKKSPADLVLTDLKMTGMDGLELLAAIPRGTVPPPVIIITAHGTIDSAVEAVRSGAFDYLTKPLDKTRVLLAVRKASERVAILNENARLKQELYGRFRLEGIIACSPAMQQVIRLLQKVVDSSSTVMALGESGSGKELVARAIHYNSPRRNRPFTAINCAAIPEALFESELFGHESGAFTGAVGRRQGLFEASDGGTIFLDEIGDLPMAMQSKLLRVLQDREVRRIGGKESIRIDVRIITATNKDLEREVELGTFREDLFYRLNVVTIDLPPLRERREDLLPLIEHYLHKFSTEFGRPVREISPEALRLLTEHRWPGNVRQLAAVMERAVLLSDGPVLTREDVASRLQTRKTIEASRFELPEEGLDFEAFEKELIRKALERSGGMATRAAKLLRMSYKAFLYRMEKFGIKNDRHGEE
jgi:DNA-binding NtrC family response regulator